MAERPPSQERGWLQTPGGWVLLAFLAIAAFFLILEHRAHVLGALPYVLFLLCPVLHLLLHRRHGGRHTGHGTDVRPLARRRTMNPDTPAYGLWLVVLSTRQCSSFLPSALRTRAARRDWRSFGAFAAFLVALFTEMYGFPLTLYLLAGWLGKSYPDSDLLSHNAGHLWRTLLGWHGDPHFDPFHILSNLLIGGGFLVLAAAWRVLYAAQRTHTLAVTGPYASVRHPQYLGFMLIMIGFLVQWPTLLTLLMFPILVLMYVRLARREEREVLAEFGEVYTRYAAETPALFSPSEAVWCEGRQ